MGKTPFVVATDRGGHLHNALMLVRQLDREPDVVLTTFGPEVEPLRQQTKRVEVIPYMFTWWGKRRVWDPIKTLYSIFTSLVLAIKLRPMRVLSTGASDVVPFCYWAWLMGARIFHVECMNQVQTPSVTGKLLYPICRSLYVQWPELLKAFGQKARYRGWVLSSGPDRKGRGHDLRNGIDGAL